MVLGGVVPVRGVCPAGDTNRFISREPAPPSARCLRLTSALTCTLIHSDKLTDHRPHANSYSSIDCVCCVKKVKAS